MNARSNFFAPILIFILCFNYLCHAQWQPSQGLDGGNCTSIISSDSLLFVSSNGIHRRTLETEWTISDNFPGRLIKMDSCIFSAPTGMNIISKRSFDNGQTWETLENFEHHEVEAIADVLVFLISENYKVYKSMDYGDSYVLISGDLSEYEFTDIFADDSLLLVLDIFEDKFFKTTDLGESWDSVTHNGLTVSGFPLFDLACYDDHLWFATREGVFFLNDAGTEWISMNNGMPGIISVNDFIERDNKLYCGTARGLFLWDRNDSLWICQSVKEKQIKKICSFNNAFFCASDKGVYSMDTSVNWTPWLDGLRTRIITSMDTSNGKMYACANDELFVSEDMGLTFGLIEGPLGHQVIATDSVLYLLSYNDVMISRDEGESWDTITGNISSRPGSMSITEDYYYVETDGFYRTETDSINWIRPNSNIQYENVWYLEAIDSVVVASIYGEGVMLSKDYGESFDTLYHGGTPPLFKIDTSLYFLGRNINFSHDLGGNWDSIPLPPMQVYFHVMDVFLDNIVIGGVGYDNHFYIELTNNSGISWTDISDGLPANYSGFLTVHLTKCFGERLFVNPGSNGLWYRDDLLTSIEESNAITQAQNPFEIYPNPGKGIFYFKFSEEPKEYQYNIFNIHGAKLKTGNIGNGNDQINMMEFEAGIYFVRILCEGKMFSDKLIKL
ncbi:MAG: T9SS type A sorting domain-containing protein [Bacteroidales bacterium]|nr:T9SS type A sorting domain-containing protein [Bacteroidales bacterium]MCF8397404.1 T9SS type A sorting domain-containing protein [Bacteroidales bacterium]